MISVKNIRIRHNYVLLKPDPDFETFQFSGKDSGLLAPSYSYQNGNRVDAKNKNFSTTGTVFGVPEKIGFTREAIKKIKASIITERNGENAVADGALLYKINRLKEAGCRFETENELSIGDRIKFSYQMHMKAEYFETEEGPMCFIKYDDIYMTISGKMVNGYILVDPEKRDTKQADGVTYAESSLGWIIPKLGETYKRSARWAHGTVLHAGKPIKGYFDFPDYCDEDVEINEGDTLIFDPRAALQYEHANHMILEDRKLYLIQRKDILFMQKENEHFEKLCTI